MSIFTGDCSRNLKIQRIKNLKDDDLLRNLPEEIITKILSRLSTRDAVRTSILSSNWERKWTSVHNINITDGGKRSTFIKFMFRTLQELERSRITSFRLVINRKYEPDYLTSWLSGILWRSCTSLIYLQILIYGTLENLPLNRCFSKLKKLCIGGGTVEYKGSGLVQIKNSQSCSSGELVLDFPALEVLEFRSCKWLNVKSVEIRAPELIRFRSYSRILSMGFNDYVMKIYAVKLKVFESFGSAPFAIDEFVLTSPSVIYAALGHTVDDSADTYTIGLRVNMILKAFPGLQRLSLSGATIKSLIRVKSEVMPLKFDQLKILHCTCDGNELLELLELVPRIVILLLSLSSEELSNYEYEKVEVFPSCLVSRLKNVMLLGFQVGRHDHVNLVKFILKNAKKLEKVLVSVDTSVCDANMTDTKLMLLGFPKASTSVSIKITNKVFVFDK